MKAPNTVYALVAISTHSPHVLQRRHGEKGLGESLATNTKLRYWEGANTVRNRWSTSVLDAAGLETALTVKPGNHEMVDWGTRAGGIG